MIKQIPSIRPETWSDAAVRETGALLESKRFNHVQTRNILEELNKRLVIAKEFDLYDPHRINPLHLKSKYAISDEFSVSPAASVHCLTLAPEGKMLIGSDLGLSVWNPGRSGYEIDSDLKLQTGIRKVRHLQCLPDGSFLMSTSGALELWARRDSQWVYEEIVKNPRGFRATPDGALYVSNSTGSFEVFRKSDAGYESERECITPTSLGDHIFDLSTELIACTVEDSGDICLCHREADGSWSAMGKDVDGMAVWCIRPYLDGQFVTCGHDGSLKIWSLRGENMKLEARLAGHSDMVVECQVFRDGRIMSLSEDKTIRLWSKNADNKWKGETIIELDTLPQCFQVLPKGQIVVGSTQGKVQIFDEVAK